MTHICRGHIDSLTGWLQLQMGPVAKILLLFKRGKVSIWLFDRFLTIRSDSSPISGLVVITFIYWFAWRVKSLDVAYNLLFWWAVSLGFLSLVDRKFLWCRVSILSLWPRSWPLLGLLSFPESSKVFNIKNLWPISCDISWANDSNVLKTVSTCHSNLTRLQIFNWQVFIYLWQQ